MVHIGIAHGINTRDVVTLSDDRRALKIAVDILDGVGQNRVLVASSIPIGVETIDESHFLTEPTPIPSVSWPGSRTSQATAGARGIQVCQRPGQPPVTSGCQIEVSSFFIAIARRANRADRRSLLCGDCREAQPALAMWSKV